MIEKILAQIAKIVNSQTDNLRFNIGVEIDHIGVEIDQAREALLIEIENRLNQIKAEEEG